MQILIIIDMNTNRNNKEWILGTLNRQNDVINCQTPNLNINL